MKNLSLKTMLENFNLQANKTELSKKFEILQNDQIENVIGNGDCTCKGANACYKKGSQ